jgi:hypothetical protein
VKDRRPKTTVGWPISIGRANQPITARSVDFFFSVEIQSGMAGIVVKELLFFIRQKYKRSFTRAQYDVPVFL